MGKRATRKAPDRTAQFTRPPLDRVRRIHHEIANGKYPNARQLAQELEVNPKTIYRDLEFMRDRLELPLAFDPRRNGYYYTAPVTDLPAVSISEGELFALVLAEKALGQYRGTPFEKPLLAAIEKIAAGLPETISVALQDLQQSISFRTRVEPLLDLEVFRTLADAVSHRRQLRLRYRKPGGGPVEERLVDPFHLANINGEWYLFAYDHLRQAPRTFVPMRIQSATPTGKTFQRPKKFSLENWLRGSFGVMQGRGDYRVILRFTPEAADYLREKKWHETQELRDLPEGGVEVTFRLSGLSEVQRWVLSWGGHCRVIEPPELAAAVRQAAERILEQPPAAPSRKA
ncbi:MAG: WYL domain-containing protein [Verrucomicrobiae bacterium]|nr:WYL domain-containing protein [Verrucomicrobiae bacterium]